MKLELKRPPPRISSEALPVGLPRPGQTLGTQVNIVLLVVAEDVNPAPSAGINGFAVGCEIECDLNKTAIVLETNIAAHSDRRASSHLLANHGPVGYAAHDPIGEQLPPGSDRRQRRIAAQIIDYGRIYLHGLTLHHYADVHRALIPQHHDRVDAAEYLRKLCLAISRSKLEQMQIDLVLAAPAVVLAADECWLLGMIVYELTTNAARHALAGRSGEIRVELLRIGAFVECKVTDNGSAQENVRQGRGLKIIEELVNALDGRFEQKFGTAGSTSTLVFPTGGQHNRPDKIDRSACEIRHEARPQI